MSFIITGCQNIFKPRGIYGGTRIAPSENGSVKAIKGLTPFI